VEFSKDDNVFAAQLAQIVGETLVDLRAKLHKEGIDGKALKDAGDLAAHNLIVDTLAKHRPQDSVLSEEGKDNTERLSANRVWIVDPLDGTREFSEVPRIDWAVHIALVVKNRPEASAVSLPAQNQIFSTADAIVVPAQVGKIKVIVSRTRRPAPAVDLASELNADYVEMGSAGAKAMAVVKGEADIYAHSGGQFEWDSCAPVGVAKSAGLHCSRLDGSELIYNQKDTYLPDLLICRPELAEQSLAILKRSLEKQNETS